MNPRVKFPESYIPIAIEEVSNYAESPELGGASADTSSRIAKIFIWGDIGGWWGVWGSDIYSELKGQSFDRIEVYISSGGGSVFEAFEIYDLLKGHPAPVHVYIFSLAASAATIIASAGDWVVMSRQSIFMIHYGMISLWGSYTAKELLKEASVVDKFDNRIADLYVRTNRVGLTAEEVRPLLDAQTWYEPEEALAAGFIDEVVDFVSVPYEAAQSSHSDFTNYFYQHTAEATIAQARAQSMGKIAASTILPGRFNNKRTEAQGQPSKPSNHTKMNFGKNVAAWISGLGLKIQNAKGETLTEDQLADLTNKDDNGAPNLIAAELRKQIVDLVKAETAESVNEGVTADKVAELLDPILDRLEALEAAPKIETKAPETESKIKALEDRLAKVSARKAGGDRLNDPQNLGLGGGDNDLVSKAFGEGSQVYRALVGSGQINAADVAAIEKQAATLRAAAGKPV